MHATRSHETRQHATLISACFQRVAHSGLAEEGGSSLLRVDAGGAQPTVDHYSGMVDPFALGGRVDDAEKMIMTAPVSADAVMWMTLLGASRLHGEVERAERVAARIFELVPQNAAVYVAAGQHLRWRPCMASKLKVGRLLPVNCKPNKGNSEMGWPT